MESVAVSNPKRWTLDEMRDTKASSRLQEVIETVETLPLNEQALLIEIIHQRLIRQRRGELAAEVAEARAAYQQGTARRGKVANLLQNLAE